MLFTFEMYDFDNDGYVTAEDIRIMLSYMQFNRNVEAKNVQSALEARMMSPVRGGSRFQKQEGLFQEDEGKNVDYKDRLSDQEEIKKFTDDIFKNKTCGVSGSHMNFKQYEAINNSVSSEMFYSLMCVLHEKLPCAKNFYRLRKQFRE